LNTFWKKIDKSKTGPLKNMTMYSVKKRSHLGPFLDQGKVLLKHLQRT